jgi:5-enolpyruvylshikimate-3-phosphate synthase
VLILTSDDGLASTGEAAAAAIAGAGGSKPTLVHMAADHSFNDHRVALAATVVRWLDTNFTPR